MKTKITTTITVEVEGQKPETFTAQTPPCFNLKDRDERRVFHATVAVLELAMSQMHRRYCPNPGETPAVQNGDATTPETEDRKAPDDDGTR